MALPLIACLAAQAFDPVLTSAAIGPSFAQVNTGFAGGGHIRVDAGAPHTGLRLLFSGTLLGQDDESRQGDAWTWYRIRRIRPLLGPEVVVSDGRVELALAVTTGPQITWGTGGVVVADLDIDREYDMGHQRWNVYWMPAANIRLYRSVALHLYGSSSLLWSNNQTEWGLGLGWLR